MQSHCRMDRVLYFDGCVHSLSSQTVRRNRNIGGWRSPDCRPKHKLACGRSPCLHLVIAGHKHRGTQQRVDTVSTNLDSHVSDQRLRGLKLKRRFVFNNRAEDSFGAIAEANITHRNDEEKSEIMRRLEDSFRRVIRFPSPSGIRTAHQWDRGRLARILRSELPRFKSRPVAGTSS
jgi:hypothetical protein